MNYPSTEAPILPNIVFLNHPAFEKECAGVFSKYHLGKDFEHLKKLLAVQFQPTRPVAVIGPGKIHRVKDFIDYTMWKVEMSARGLRKNQSPRVWFAVRGDTVLFLCIKLHGDNYDDNAVNSIAEALISDVF